MGETIEGLVYMNIENTPYVITGGSEGKLKVININTQTTVFDLEMPMN
jgi:U3 small nucleolar RNA-associated protein 13